MASCDFEIVRSDAISAGDWIKHANDNLALVVKVSPDENVYFAIEFSASGDATRLEISLDYPRHVVRVKRPYIRVKTVEPAEDSYSALPTTFVLTIDGIVVWAKSQGSFSRPATPNYFSLSTLQLSRDKPEVFSPITAIAIWSSEQACTLNEDRLLEFDLNAEAQ